MNMNFVQINETHDGSLNEPGSGWDRSPGEYKLCCLPFPSALPVSPEGTHVTQPGSKQTQQLSNWLLVPTSKNMCFSFCNNSL